MTSKVRIFMIHYVRIGCTSILAVGVLVTASCTRSAETGKGSNVKRIVAFGDSITECSTVWGAGKRWPFLLEKKLNEKGPAAYKVINSGVSGNTVLNALRRIEHDVIRHSPDAVIVEFGFNDCYYLARDLPDGGRGDYKKSMKEIVGMMKRRTNAAVILVANHKTMVNTMMPNGKTYEENMIAYNGAVREIAEEETILLCDMHGAFADHGSRLSALLTEDGLHLSEEGSAAYCEAVFSFLKANGF